MNLDSNHAYGNRFVRVGQQGFSPSKVTNFYQNHQGEVVVYFSGMDDDFLRFLGDDADLVWEYLTANSDELTKQVYVSEGPDGGIEGAGLDRPLAF
jgi:hypothetical protein